MNIYTYDLATYFGAGLNEEKLKDEVNSNANIVTHCADVGLAGTDAAITFSGPISAGEQTELETVVLPAHDSTPTPADTGAVLIANEDGSHANFPMTTKKTPIFQPSIIVPGDLFYGTGAFDEVTGDHKIGDGDLIVFDTSTPDDVVVVEGRFHHYVRIIGGKIATWSSTVRDSLSLEIVFPASAPAATPGTGNAVIMNGVFVPIATGDGTHTVDGATLEVGHINQDLCPVPAVTQGPDGKDVGVGFWNWDPSASPSITPSYDMTGFYHLIPAEIAPLRQANRYPVADMDVTPAAGIQSKKVLPHWIWRFNLKKGPDAGETKFRVLLYTSRVTTK